MMTRNGSIPAFVMRTGMIQPMSPENARRDITTAHVLDVTLDPVDESVPSAFLPTSQRFAPDSPVAQTVTAIPPTPIQTPPGPMPPSMSGRYGWHQNQRRQHPAIDDIRRLHPRAQLQGAAPVELGEWQGRPVAKFEIQASPSAVNAQAAADALRRAAHALVQNGFSHLPPELVAGPLAALMRGGAVEMHFQNGVVIRTAI